jgi:hypothetical protein
MSSLSQIGQSRGFGLDFVALLHPDWPSERLHSFWRGLNPLPEVRRRRKAHASTSVREVPCMDCGEPWYWKPHSAGCRPPQRCPACRDKLAVSKEKAHLEELNAQHRLQWTAEHTVQPDHYTGRGLTAKTPRECHTCHKVFLPPTPRSARARFCSAECRHTAEIERERLRDQSTP